MLWNKTVDPSGTTFTIESATWGAVMALIKMKFSVVFYQPKDECAFLFTECEYAGNYSPVCPDVHQPTFSVTPFKDKDVKSIYIPENKKVTLYELENYEGMQATFDSN